MQSAAIAISHSARPRPRGQGVQLTPLEFRLLNEYQKGLPPGPTPFATIAERLGVGEPLVLETLQQLQGRGLISRVGPVFTPLRIGTSTLAAMAVPAERLSDVAAIVSGYDEVNHNYEREHEINLWFVATAPDRNHLDAVLAEIEARTGIRVFDLPMLEDFHLDLGFSLWC